MIHLTQSAVSAIQRLSVKSALNPMLWLCGLGAIPIAFGIAILTSSPTLAAILVFIGVSPYIVAMLMFIYFAIKCPEKLQSEEYQLRHEALQLVQEKTGTAVLDPVSLTAIANPVHEALPAPEEEPQ